MNLEGREMGKHEIKVVYHFSETDGMDENTISCGRLSL